MTCIECGRQFEAKSLRLDTSPKFFEDGLPRRRLGGGGRTIAKMPERGLEPLRIAPPDPKSGASANFATPASLKGTAIKP